MNILIIEDEAAAVRRLQKLLTEINPNIRVLSSLATVTEAIEWLGAHPKPDLIFMDIQLADGSSFEIFEQTIVPAPVIFTTAYDEFAIKAFKVKAIDYLLKPVKQIELEEAISHFAALRSGIKTEGLREKLVESGLVKKPKRILVKTGAQMKLLELDQVQYFYSRDKITYAVPVGQRKMAIDPSLDQIEHWVETSLYFRISRQYIVSLHSIEEMTITPQSRIKLKLTPASDEEVLVSKEKSADFRKWLLGESDS